jgi:large subunit ribosomal protein L10
MKTKDQKKEEVAKGAKLLQDSKVVLLADFTKLPAEAIRQLRRSLRESEASLKVMKKRLLRIVLKEKGIDYDPKISKTSVGAVFAGSDVEVASSPLVKFFKQFQLEKTNIIGGYDVATGKWIAAEEVAFLGTLPPREVLLSQVLGMFAAPLKSFMYVVDQKSKQSN